MFCPYCGRQNEPDASFCSSCGYKLDPNAVAAPFDPPAPAQEEPVKEAGMPALVKAPTSPAPKEAEVVEKAPPVQETPVQVGTHKPSALVAIGLALVWGILTILLSLLANALKAHLNGPVVMVFMGIPSLGLGIGGLYLMAKKLKKPEAGLPKKTALLFLGLACLCSTMCLTIAFYPAFDGGQFIFVVATAVYIALLVLFAVLGFFAAKRHGQALLYNLLRAFCISLLPAFALAYLIGQVLSALFIIIAILAAVALFFFTSGSFWHRTK